MKKKSNLCSHLSFGGILILTLIVHFGNVQRLDQTRGAQEIKQAKVQKSNAIRGALQKTGDVEAFHPKDRIAELGEDLPDLVVIEITPRASFVDEEITQTALIGNIGDGPVEHFEVKFQSDETPQLILEKTTISYLEEGQTVEIKFQRTTRTPGEFTVTVVVDPENTIEECDERNNTMDQQLRVELFEGGWCNLGDKIFPSSEHTCEERGGRFFLNWEDADRCRCGDEYNMGWCCNRDGKVFKTTELVCRILGGVYCQNLDEAEEISRRFKSTIEENKNETLKHSFSMNSEENGKDDASHRMKPSDYGTKTIMAATGTLSSGSEPFSVIEDVSPGPGSDAEGNTYAECYGRMVAIDGAFKAAKNPGKILYSAAPWGGVWRSDDYGNNWKQMIRPMPAKGDTTEGAIDAPMLLDLAVSPVNPNLILVAAYDDAHTISRNGIYRSINGGKSWKRVHQPRWPSGKISKVTQICFAPDDTKLIYAAQGSGIAVSTDAGATWPTKQQMIFQGVGEAWSQNHVWHIAIGPKESGGKRRLYACGDGKLWHSPDAGKNWYEDKGLKLPGTHRFGEATTPFVGNAAKIMEVEPGHPDHLYLIYKHLANGPRYFTHYPETNGKQCNTWVDVSDEHKKALSKKNDPLYNKTTKKFYLAAGEGSVWLGDYSGFKKEDNTTHNASWKQMPGPPVYWGVSTPSGCIYIKAHATKSGYLLFFSDRSHVHMTVGRPKVNGWHRLDGWDVSKCKQKNQLWNHLDMHVDPHAITVSADFDLTLKSATGVSDPYNKNTLLDKCSGGRIWLANDGGIYSSTDCGKSWKLSKSGPNTLIAVNLAGMASLFSSPALYMGTVDNDDFFTTDGGQIWNSPIGACGDCGVWFADPAANEVMEIGSIGRKDTRHFLIYEGSSGHPDASKTWTKILPYPAGSILKIIDGSRPVIQTLATESTVTNGDYILIEKTTTSGKDVYKLLRAKNGAYKTSSSAVPVSKLWKQVGPDLPHGAFIFQASGGHQKPVYYVGNNSKIWRSKHKSDGTVEKWIQIVPGGGAVSARRFFVNPYDPKNIYIIGYDAVKCSNDSGKTWQSDKSLDTHVTDNGRFFYPSWGSKCIINDLVFDRMDPKKRFAVGVAGVFYTKNGKTWHRILDTKAIPSRPLAAYYDAISSPVNDVVYVSTYGRGVLNIHHPIFEKEPPDLNWLEPPYDLIIPRPIPEHFPWIIELIGNLINNGRFQVDNPFWVLVSLDGEPVHRERIHGLGPGERFEFDFSLEVNEGEHVLEGKIDAEHQVEERDEENNIISIPFRIPMEEHRRVGEFEDGFGDGMADGWDLEPGWRLEAMDGNFMLVGLGHQWARLARGDDWDDYAFQARFRIVRGIIHINYRISEEGRYFIGIREDGLYLKKEKPWGRFFDLDQCAMRLDPGIWHDIEITGEGDRLRITIDGELVIDTIDDNPLIQGSIAFETLEETEAHVDDVKVIGLK